MYKPSFMDICFVDLGDTFAASCSAWTGTVIPFNFLLCGHKRINQSNPTSALLSLMSLEKLIHFKSKRKLDKILLYHLLVYLKTDFLLNLSDFEYILSDFDRILTDFY